MAKVIQPRASTKFVLLKTIIAFNAVYIKYNYKQSAENGTK